MLWDGQEKQLRLLSMAMIPKPLQEATEIPQNKKQRPRKYGIWLGAGEK